MGFWDRQLFDFEVAGLRVSDLEVDALENGGPVALVLTLPTPDWIYGHQEDQNDGQGNRIYVPLLLDAEAPLAIMQKGTLRSKAVTFANEMDGEYGDAWREHPSYIGNLQWDSAERFSQYFVGWQEYTRAYRVWCGRPLLPQEQEPFKRLQTATFQRLNDSSYFFVEAVLQHEECGDIDLEAAAVHFGYGKPPAGTDLEPWQSRWEQSDSGWNEDYLKEIAQEYAEHADRNHIFYWSWASEREEGTGMEFKPLETYLQPGDVEAYDLWTSLIARREVMKRRVEAYWHADSGYQFNWNERHLA